MTAKAKMKKIAVTVPPAANGNKPQAVQPDYKLIPRRDLQPSPTNPRRRIDEKSIESLAGSIGKQGVLEPLIVRAAGKKYEIVCGERRWRAAGAVKDDQEKPKPLELLPCLVRELSDEQVLDIQIHENLHREDVHPMDEAYGYQFLKDKLGCDIKELALRVGKPEGYVLNRLRLNLLIEEAQKDIDDGHLPLSYALEMAKYSPDIQKYIYGEVYRKEGKYQCDEYVYIPKKGETVPLKSLVEWINTNIHRLLAKAPFDTKATDLRPDGLACVNCPERTGAVVSLFEPNQIGKKDACLNPACYVQKTHNHVQIRLQAIAESSGIEVSEVPIVRSFCYSDGKDYLGTESVRVISGTKRDGKSKNCRNAVSGIDIEADNYGKTVQVCLKSSNCKVHWPQSKTASKTDSAKSKSSEEEAAQRLEAYRMRREEIWNAKVAEVVRVQVFKRSAESFEKKFSIADVGVDFVPQLVARFWRMAASGDSNNLKVVVRPLLAEWDEESRNQGISVSDGQTGIDSVKNLKRGLQFRILFLLVHGHKGAISQLKKYAPQTEVKELASEFEVDYTLTDAEMRLELSPKKHQQVHEVYLDAVRKKTKDAKVPRLLSELWQAND